MNNDSEQYVEILKKVRPIKEDELRDWTDEAFIVKKTIRYSMHAGDKAVKFEIRENAKWNTTADKR